MALTRIIDDRQTPQRRAEVIRALREGSLAVHALPFTLHTESLEIEDLVRGLHFSSQIARDIGKPLPIAGKMTDVPGHSWIMPTLLRHAGIRLLHIGGNGGVQFMRVPPLFWWQGPDGSRILCAYTPDYGSQPIPGPDWPAKNYLAMIMEGDNHGPPTAEEVENVRRTIAAGLPTAKVTFGTLDDFAKAIERENPDLKVICGDMPDTWIQGLMSNPIESGMGRRIRPLEPALDALDTQLRAWGEKPSSLDKALAAAYENSLLYGEHTWGSDGKVVGDHFGADWKNLLAKGYYDKWLRTFEDKCDYIRTTERIVAGEIRNRLQMLAASVKAEGPRIVVYNPLPWRRTGLVQLPDARDGAVKDLRSGEAAPLRNGCFLAKAVPASGYKTFSVDLAAGLPSANDDRQIATALNTVFYRVTFDLRRGAIASLIEKAGGRELADKSSPYTLGQFLHERFSSEDVETYLVAYCRHHGQPCWERQDLGKDGMPGPDKSPYAATTPSQWTMTVEHGPSFDRAVLTAGDSCGLAQRYTMVFTFARHEPSVEVKWSVCNKTPNPIPEGGWLCFPFAVKDPQFTLGRLGALDRPRKACHPRSESLSRRGGDGRGRHRSRCIGRGSLSLGLALGQPRSAGSLEVVAGFHPQAAVDLRQPLQQHVQFEFPLLAGGVLERASKDLAVDAGCRRRAGTGRKGLGNPLAPAGGNRRRPRRRASGFTSGLGAFAAGSAGDRLRRRSGRRFRHALACLGAKRPRRGSCGCLAPWSEDRTSNAGRSSRAAYGQTDCRRGRNPWSSASRLRPGEFSFEQSLSLLLLAAGLLPQGN